MTADTAKEIITEELKNDMPTPLRNAMNMAVQALGVWDHYQDIEYDYKKQGEMLGGLIAYYRKDEKPIHRDGVCSVRPAARRSRSGTVTAIYAARRSDGEAF